MTHSYLPGLSPGRLRDEIVEAKAKLEEMIGVSVDHFSCPGGRWSARAADIAREAGYLSVATSRTGANAPATDRFRLARVAIKRGIRLAHFERICRGEGLTSRQTREVLLAAAKGILGDSTYEKVRSRMLDKAEN